MKFSVRTSMFILALFILFFSMHTTVSAQCKTVIKTGIKKLAPYTHNGQINNVNIKNGKVAEIHLSFYKGLYYKLQISSEKSVGKISFRVLDENNVEVYNSMAKDDNAEFWNFYSNSAQDLIIELKPENNTDSEGCVAVLVGMQIPKSNNPIRNL